VLREETERTGAVLIADEIKTIGRLAMGGGCERFGVRPDLVVMGKAIANGFPLAAVGGRADLMVGVARTWISSTLATELVSLAAARATLAVLQARRVPEQLGRIGAWLVDGLRGLAQRHPRHIRGVAGLPEMCCLLFHDEAVGAQLAAEAARRGVLFKRSAYNFVSMTHGEREVERAVGVRGVVLVGFGCGAGRAGAVVPSRRCHPERSEGSCPGMVRARRSRSLASLGMTPPLEKSAGA
jgi:glutamate-1-semialdehyde 2,1-aminomutase